MRTTRVVGVVALAVAAVAVWAVLGSSPDAAPAPDPTVPTATALVRRGDVTERVEVAGTLRFGGRYVVRSQLPPGIVTAAARPGATIERGGRLFAVSGTPVLLLYGATPAYRRFHRGMTDGPDVRALERNLVALGMDPWNAIVVDGHFDSATKAAVVRWQAARGVPPSARSGTVPLGRVAFLAHRVRIGRAIAPPGTTVQPGMPVMSATSTRALAVARVGTDQRHLIRAGSRVRVTLAGAGRGIRGTVTRIGTVASSGDGSGTPTVAASVALDTSSRPGAVEHEPVQVSIIAARRRGVLTVPVTALLARSGGYAVRVVQAAATTLVEVTPGLYDDDAGTVEVSGTGLREGMSVEVPAA